MDYKLTKEQSKHLESIEWLISDQRAVGKSFLLALAFIDKAVNNRGMLIRVFDHFPERQATIRLLCTIENIISQDKKLLERTEFEQNGFRINSEQIKRDIELRRYWRKQFQ